MSVQCSGSGPRRWQISMVYLVMSTLYLSAKNFFKCAMVTRAGHCRYLLLLPLLRLQLLLVLLLVFSTSLLFKPVSVVVKMVNGSIPDGRYSRLKLTASSGAKINLPLTSSPRCSGVVQSAILENYLLGCSKYYHLQRK